MPLLLFLIPMLLLLIRGLVDTSGLLLVISCSQVEVSTINQLLQELPSATGPLMWISSPNKQLRRLALLPWLKLPDWTSIPPRKVLLSLLG
jgi:hypothetical protein